MKAKMSNEQMEYLISFMANLKEKGKLGYIIAYNFQKISEVAKPYINMKTELLQKYGKEDKQHGGYFVRESDDPEKFAKYKEELGEIPKMEIEVDGILKVTPEELYTSDLTSSQMTNLMWMVDDTEKGAT